MKITKELRSLSGEELQNRLIELKKERLKLGVEASSGANPSSPGKVRRVKKNIARIITLTQEKVKEVKL
ncbi:MAG TPA: 50S ribosomal protein L29 [Candidatus Nanoarchaeia archaeon]|nr:50S ribosomal protein L29 [Candidatus Nanoarchaeia archaeon]